MTVQDAAHPPPCQPARRGGRWLIGASLAACLALAPIAVQAAETVLPVTPPGSTDTDQAVLPPKSGLYIGLFALPYSADRNTYDSQGRTLPAAANVHITSPIAGAAFLYVYPFRPLGGVLGSTFVQPFSSQTTSIGNGEGFGKGNTNVGPMDAFSDIVFWSKYVGRFGASTGYLPINYGLTFGAAFSMVLPDGGYDHNHIFKLGGHSWVFDPNISLTYNTGPRLSLGSNTQVSTRLFYALPQPNFSDGYHTGNIVDLDWSVTEQFGAFRAGVSGYYQAQVTNDHLPNGSIPPGGGKYSEAAVGPIAEYFFRNGMFVKAKYSWTVFHKNYVDQQFFLVSTGFRF